MSGGKWWKADARLWNSVPPVRLNRMPPTAFLRLMLYFFDVQNGDGSAPDDEGIDLPDAQTARARAIEGARSMLAEMVLRRGELDLNGAVTIRDASGAVIDVVSFSHSVSITTSDN